LELSLKCALEGARRSKIRPRPSEWLRQWYSPRALDELLAYRTAIDELADGTNDVASVGLSRAARSARSTTPFDLDFPKHPIRDPYFCHKHKRVCHPVDEADKFLRRYTVDTIRRLREFSSLRRRRKIVVMHGDSRRIELPTRANGIITSPPYPGLIDYHEQHRYAYELLGLEDRRASEIGPAARGLSRAALEDYVDGMAAVFRTSAAQLSQQAPVVIVVNDSRDLYPEILRRAGLSLEERIRRHVNRRTGRRAGEFFEDVLVCRAP
jgi:hypothetical protein